MDGTETIVVAEHQGVERLRDFDLRDWWHTAIAAARSALDHHVPLLASALSYSNFFAIPSLLLVAVGFFTLTTSAGTIDSLMSALQGAVPAQALDLFSSSLKQIDSRAQNSASLIVVSQVVNPVAWQSI